MKKSTYLFLTVLVALLMCGCNDNTTNTDDDLRLIPDESKNYVKIGNDIPIYFEDFHYGYYPDFDYVKFTIVVEAINDTHRFNARISLTLADNTLKELKDGEYNYLNIETLDHVDDYDFLNSSFIMTYAQTNIPGKALYVERGSFVVTTVKKEKHVKGTFTLTTGETMLINFYI